MPDLADDLSNALAAMQSEKKPCRCHEQAAASDPFAGLGLEAAADLSANLDAALSALEAADEPDPFASLETDLAADLAFSELSEGLAVTLEQILEVLESRPGLKITLSY
jgi:hypothetical protein